MVSPDLSFLSHTGGALRATALIPTPPKSVPTPVPTPVPAYNVVRMGSGIGISRAANPIQVVLMNLKDRLVGPNLKGLLCNLLDHHATYYAIPDACSEVVF